MQHHAHFAASQPRQPSRLASSLPSYWLLGACLLSACTPTAQLNFEQQPTAHELGAKNAPTEWWYVSGYLPESQLSFHWAQFKVKRYGLTYHAGHVAVLDLRTKKLKMFEQKAQNTRFGFPPLLVQQDKWQLKQQDHQYLLRAGPLNLQLTPRKAAVVHPPGYSGTPELGRMFYQSITRLDVVGSVQIAGQKRRASGQAWLDHQWGDQSSGQTALWDWFGLHLSNGADLMLYRVRDTKGKVAQLAGSYIDQNGRAKALTKLKMTPLRSWKSPSGRQYVLNWRIEAPNLQLELGPLNDNQELLSKSTFVAYWEGPITGKGQLFDQPISAQGMGEFVAGTLRANESQW